MEKKQCGNCYHWEDEEDENGYGVKFSRCHRFPPVVIPHELSIEGIDHEERERLGFRGSFFDFPWVSEHSHCGEFKTSNVKLRG